MTGIKNIAVHLPYYRLSRGEIGKAWGTGGGAGERRVANFDEDSITMAIEAGFRCLKQSERDHVRGLYFASTTAPYWEKQCAGLCAGVLDLFPDIRTGDFGGSTRSSTNAFLAAADAVNAGLGDVLVITADCRRALPRSSQEGVFGDGGAAIVLGDADVICALRDSCSVWDDITDVWRMDKDDFVKTWEDRFILQMGYEKGMEHAITAIMKRNQLKGGEIDKVVCYSPDGRSHQRVLKKVGFKPEQIQNPLVDKIGNTGSAQAFIMLASALSEAKTGQVILWVNYGSGSDALLLEVTNEIETKAVSLAKNLPLNMGEELSYQKYLAFRGLVQTPQEIVRLFPSASVMWRTRHWAASLHGSKCTVCGTITFPIQRVCFTCKTKDDFEEVRLSDKKGKIFTYSLDNLAGGPNPPTIQAIVEMEDGARIYCLLTDCNPNRIEIGMPVEMTYRLFHEEGGFYNYYWKAHPAYGD